jgi:hypothetical protein
MDGRVYSAPRRVFRVHAYDPRIEGNHWRPVAACESQADAELVAVALLTSARARAELGSTHLEVWERPQPGEGVEPRLRAVFDAGAAALRGGRSARRPMSRSGRRPPPPAAEPRLRARGCLLRFPAPAPGDLGAQASARSAGQTPPATPPLAHQDGPGRRSCIPSPPPYSPSGGMSRLRAL